MSHPLESLLDEPLHFSDNETVDLVNLLSGLKEGAMDAPSLRLMCFIADQLSDYKSITMRDILLVQKDEHPNESYKLLENLFHQYAQSALVPKSKKLPRGSLTIRHLICAEAIQSFRETCVKHFSEEKWLELLTTEGISWEDYVDRFIQSKL